MLALGAGCIERPTTIDPVPSRPHEGVTLTVAAGTPADRELVRRLAASWATRSGATVTVVDAPFDGSNADVGLIAPAELGRFAEAKSLTDVPAAIRGSEPYKYEDLLAVYGNRLTRWNGSPLALPVLGEGMVLAYRRAAFDGQEGRPAPPATWDELLDAAKALGPKSLPPLPGDESLNAQFFAAAACYDKPAVGRLASGQLPGDDFFTFQYDPGTGAPRLDAPAFRHVAELFRQMRPFRATELAAMTVGVVTLAELAKLTATDGDAWGVAPVPGAGFTFVGDQRRPTDQRTVNRVPYVGWGGRVGVVSGKSANGAAAWDFLADAGMPERAALDVVAATRWGAGPYRSSQLDGRSRSKWLAYQLTTSETDRLATILRDVSGSGILNYRLRVRTPNEAELSRLVSEELRRIVSSDQPADLSALNAKWKAAIEKEPDWRAQARRGLGL